MSRAGIMARRRCVEYVGFVIIIQLILTVGSLWFFREKPHNTVDPESRLLLSMEYLNRNADLVKSASNKYSNNVEIPEAFSSKVSYSVSRSVSSSSSKPSNVVLDLSGLSMSANESEFAIDFDEERTFLDRYRMFKTSLFTVTGTKWNELSRSRKVCLGAQTSIDRASWLIEIVKNWSGPVSIALFTPDVEFHISKIYIKYMQRCFPKIKEQVSFHFLFPVDHPVKDSPSLNEIVGEMSCDDPKKVLDFLVKTRSKEMLAWREPMEYPQNLLRNTAKQGCQTQFTFIPDIDMIPNAGLDLDLQEFLSGPEAQECEKCAYVVPTYEISTTSTHMPANKTELLGFLKQKKARIFHEAVYKLNSKSSDLKKWQAIPMKPKLDVAYMVNNYIFKYEPLYVAKGNTPPFDERFIGFGMTRNTQAYEMYVSGYEFFVLNNAFTNHWGFQSIKTRPKYRALQQMKNNHLFDDFAKEITARYGRDPYKMMSKLKSLNLKNSVVSYEKGKVPPKLKPSPKPKPAKEFFQSSLASSSSSSSTTSTTQRLNKSSTTTTTSSETNPDTTILDHS
ncbi:beta-1,4-glucuronyltransferase 1-like [Tigriopus californicus]|uniref:beta-1,4-glucuronyltransferase 1-like n=1 Tax=Tigriopus californicus TaxID=6832 RepID=UPI0027DA0433|nr:beta-1,4-glucuronyltransferase 1-like [Tigriopus californicus]